MSMYGKFPKRSTGIISDSSLMLCYILSHTFSSSFIIEDILLWCSTNKSAVLISLDFAYIAGILLL